MKEQIQTVIQGLTALLAQMKTLGDLGEEIDSAQAKLKATTDQHAKVTAKLSDSSKLLSAAQLEAVKKHDQEMYDKTTKLRQLTGQVKAAQQTLDDLNVQVSTARTEHDQILASLDSLRKRLG